MDVYLGSTPHAGCNRHHQEYDIFSRGSRTKPFTFHWNPEWGVHRWFIYYIEVSRERRWSTYIHSQIPRWLCSFKISHFPPPFLRKKANKLQQIKEDAEICKRSWRVPREVIFMVIMAFGRNGSCPGFFGFLYTKTYITSHNKWLRGRCLWRSAPVFKKRVEWSRGQDSLGFFRSLDWWSPSTAEITKNGGEGSNQRSGQRSGQRRSFWIMVGTPHYNSNQGHRLND